MTTHQSIDRLYRISEVEKITGFARSTIYLRLRQERFPPPIYVGANSVRWKHSDLQEWLDGLPASNPEVNQ